jgi:hypothetical protein
MNRLPDFRTTSARSVPRLTNGFEFVGISRFPHTRRPALDEKLVIRALGALGQNWKIFLAFWFPQMAQSALRSESQRSDVAKIQAHDRDRGPTLLPMVGQWVCAPSIVLPQAYG